MGEIHTGRIGWGVGHSYRFQQATVGNYVLLLLLILTVAVVGDEVLLLQWLDVVVVADSYYLWGVGEVVSVARNTIDAVSE